MKRESLTCSIGTYFLQVCNLSNENKIQLLYIITETEEK